MKRSAFVVLLVLFPTFLAAEPEQRYIVALKRGVPAAHAGRMLRDIEVSTQTRDVSEFSRLDAFAASLTRVEVDRLEQSPNVRFVEPVVERHLLGSLPAAGDATRNLNGQTVPFGIDLVRARDVWPVVRGNTINVAVIDTGVDYTHPDIAPAWAGGYNAMTKTNDPRDDNGHGTHVSGTIAAADNGIGVVGVAPNVRLWGIKALDAKGSGTNENVIGGLNWVIGQKRSLGGNWVVNLSLGSAESSIIEREAFAKGVDEGLLIVAASGNESMPQVPAAVGYPAAYPGVIAVGAVTEQSLIGTFSNQGPELALVAPGVDVLSTVRMGTANFAALQTDTGSVPAAALNGSKRGSINGEWVFCGVGKPEQFPASVKGRIAVVRRGEGITFAVKAQRAKAAGATAVVIVNHDTSPLAFTLIDPADPDSAAFDWPVVVAVRMADGDALIAKGSGTVLVTNQADDYSTFNGTSMASPHAAGVAALAWSAAPNASRDQVRQALFLTATDLGTAGKDVVFGHGLVHALNAAKMLAPAAFSSPSTPADVPNGRRMLRRGGK